jgi:hypothetical protein
MDRREIDVARIGQAYIRYSSGRKKLKPEVNLFWNTRSEAAVIAIIIEPRNAERPDVLKMTEVSNNLPRKNGSGTQEG